jgi:hypothetical protein
MPPEPTAVCGTYAAAVRHLRRGEPLDEACAQALTDYRREAVAKHRAKKNREAEK